MSGRNTYRFAVVAILAIVLTGLLSCRKDLPLPDIKGSNKITLIGEFVAGDTFALRGGQSLAVKSGATLKFEILRGLSIEIKDAQGNVYSMEGHEDSFSQRLYTIPFVLQRKVQPGDTYHVKAMHQSLGTAEAAVYIPGPVEASVKDTAAYKYASENTIKIKVKINDPAAAVNYYVIEVIKQPLIITGYFYYNNDWLNMEIYSSLYNQLKSQGPVTERYDSVYTNEFVRQALYTADGNAENFKDKGAFTRNKRVLLNDLAFNGEVYNTEVYMTLDSIAGGSSNGTAGRYTLYIKSIAKDYFTFLKAYEAYDPSTGFNTLEQPVKIQGNISNGMGMIGGVSQVKYVFIRE